jgi:hypothetical protein
MDWWNEQNLSQHLTQNLARFRLTPHLLCHIVAAAVTSTGQEPAGHGLVEWAGRSVRHHHSTAARRAEHTVHVSGPAAAVTELSVCSVNNTDTAQGGH